MTSATWENITFKSAAIVSNVWIGIFSKFQQTGKSLVGIRLLSPGGSTARIGFRAGHPVVTRVPLLILQEYGSTAWIWKVVVFTSRVESSRIESRTSGLVELGCIAKYWIYEYDAVQSVQFVICGCLYYLLRSSAS